MNEMDSPFTEFENKGPWFRRPKVLLITFMTVFTVFLVYFFYRTTIRESWNERDVAQAVQIVHPDSRWVDKKGLHGEVIIVPALTFRIRNASQRNLRFVCFDGVFMYQDSKETIGSGYIETVKKPLPPGQESEEITLKSDFGYTATSKKAFYDNIKEWKKVEVKIFAKSQGSGYVTLGVYPIKQAIQGVQVIETPAPVPEVPAH
jgi:hypothetical protein